MTRQISDFFSLLNHTIARSAIQKEFIIESIFCHTQIRLEAKEIQVKKYIIALQVKPLYRETIFSAQEKILEELAQSTGKKFTIQ